MVCLSVYWPHAQPMATTSCSISAAALISNSARFAHALFSQIQRGWPLLRCMQALGTSLLHSNCCCFYGAYTSVSVSRQTQSMLSQPGCLVESFTLCASWKAVPGSMTRLVSIVRSASTKSTSWLARGLKARSSQSGAVTSFN